jgi:hypothetical protein
LLTVVGELAGTFTVKDKGLNDPPGATTAVVVQVAVEVPEQLQPVPLNEASVYPEGSVSLTVTVEPSVGPVPVLPTWMFQVAVAPCVKVPVCDFVTESAGELPE